MKHSILIYASIIAAFMLTVSCGGNDKSVTPAKETISGPLGSYFSVVDRAYKIKDGKVNIEIERIAEGLPSPWEEGIEVGYNDNRVEPEFLVEFLDEDGDILCKDKSDIVWDKDALVAIVSLAVGESASIPFSVSEKKAAKFKVSSTFKYHGPQDSGKSVSNTISSETTSTESTNWDELLTEYEKYVDKYIAMYKKAMAGDLNALSSYASLLESAEKISVKLQNAGNDMTAAQLNRYMKLSEKMASAVMDEDSSSSSSSSSASSAGSSKWDDMLSNCEKYLNKCESLKKKVKAHDESACDTFDTMFDKAEEILDIIERSESSLSADQLIKYRDLSDKLEKLEDLYAND